MFDTMTMTKIGGALFGALLFFLLGNWAAGGLYSTAIDSHGDEAHAPGYIIASHDDGDDHGDEPMEDVMTFAEVLATADVGKGEKVFNKCKACHKLEAGETSVGPDLFAVVGRAVGSVDGFSYSDTVAGLGGNWDVDALNGWLENPKSYAPGNKMTFAGLSKETDRANLIAFLATVGGDGLVMEEAAAPAEPVAVEEEPVTEVAEEAPVAEEVVEEEPAEDVAMVADIAAGEKVFKKCKACHKLEDGVNGVGPSLYGIVGRDVGAAEGFNYSNPMAAFGGVWDEARLDEYLLKPKDMVPGTKMSFSGLRKEADRLNVIAYLATIGG